MWVVVNRCLKLSSFTEEPFTSRFAVRTRHIQFVETGKNGFFRLTLNDGEEIMCVGSFDNFVALLGKEVEG